MMMNHSSDIQELLDRYWEGETTLEEERRLKAFFAAGQIPQEYQREARFFQALREEQAVQLAPTPPAALPRRVFRWYAVVAAALVLLCTAGIWWWNAGQVPQAGREEVVLRPVTQPPVLAPAKKEMLDPVQLSGSGPSLEKPKRQVKKQRIPAPVPVPPAPDTYEDPGQALAEIKAVLELVSAKINKGRRTVDKGLQEVDHLDILRKKKHGSNG